MTTIDHLRNHISISLCPHPAPLVILTHTLVVCRKIARELRAILMQIILSPFPSSRSSVTFRMHCYFPCLLLSRVFFFPSSAEQRPFWAQLCRLHDFGAMWATHLCVCVHTSAYVYFIAVNHRLILPFRFLFCLSAAPWLTTLGRHVRDLLLPFQSLFFPSVIRYFCSSAFRVRCKCIIINILGSNTKRQLDSNQHSLMFTKIIFSYIQFLNFL